MKQLTITNGFTRMRDASLELRATQIAMAMTDNPNFPTPEPTISNLNDAIDGFSEALNNCLDGDRLKVAIKNQKRAELIEVLHQLADYVLFKSAGDTVVAISSGFSIGKQPAPAPPITKPENLRVEQGANPGELFTKIDRVKGAMVYLYQYATDAMMAQNNWSSLPSSRSKCIIPNLQPGVKYNCRVAAVGARDQLMYSDVVSRFVAA